jgi:2-phosphoglycerate kinase
MALVLYRLPRLVSAFNFHTFTPTLTFKPNTSTKAVFVLGAPGSGKSTQSSKLASEFGLAHLSAGALIRDLISLGGTLSKQLTETIKEGQIIPSHV